MCRIRLDPDSFGPVDLDPRRLKKKDLHKKKKDEEMLDVPYTLLRRAGSVSCAIAFTTFVEKYIAILMFKINLIFHCKILTFGHKKPGSGAGAGFTIKSGSEFCVVSGFATLVKGNFR